MNRVPYELPVLSWIMRSVIRAALLASVFALVLGSTVPTSAQPPGRVATTAAAMRAAPVFFHGKQVAVLGSVVESRGMFRLEGPAAPRQPT